MPVVLFKGSVIIKKTKSIPICHLIAVLAILEESLTREILLVASKRSYHSINVVIYWKKNECMGMPTSALVIGLLCLVVLRSLVVQLCEV